MANETHGFCTVHRIGYDRRLDAFCPQCVRSGQSFEQWDFHTGAQKPINPKTNNLHDPQTMREWAAPDQSSAKPVNADSV